MRLFGVALCLRPNSKRGIRSNFDTMIFHMLDGIFKDVLGGGLYYHIYLN